jgi:hypothetical protein
MVLPCGPSLGAKRAIQANENGPFAEHRRHIRPGLFRLWRFPCRNSLQNPCSDWPTHTGED